MSADDLAAELLEAVLRADPFTGSLFGFPGYDDLLPDFGLEAEQEDARRLGAVAERAERMPDGGLEEADRQTLDFVRCLARNLADAAAVPLVEFTICDTMVAPVNQVLTSLPKVPLDTADRRSGYLARLQGLPAVLATAAERQREGSAAGRTAVALLVHSTLAQLDLLIADPTVGAIRRDDAGRRELRR